MAINPQRVRLDSELADLDNSLGPLIAHLICPAERRWFVKVTCNINVEKKILEVEILEQGASVESRNRSVEAARKRNEWARTPDGLKVLVQREQQRQAGMALGGGMRRNYTSLDRLPPEERVMKIVEGELRRADLNASMTSKRGSQKQRDRSQVYRPKTPNGRRSPALPQQSPIATRSVCGTTTKE